MYIDENKINCSSKIIGYGSYSTIYLSEYKKHEYACKVFDQHCYKIDKKQEEKFEKLCNKYNKSNLILPKYLIKNNNITSYLTDYYNGNTFDKLFYNTFDNKIKYLRIVKNLIIKLHSELQIVHSDIHFGNILFNSEKQDVAIIDFDNSKIEDLMPEYCYLSTSASDFLSYNDFDCNIDIHLFNLLSFGLLNNMGQKDAFYNLNNPKYNSFFTSKTALKTLEDISLYKKNNNFLIDMIDENYIKYYKHI